MSAVHNWVTYRNDFCRCEDCTEDHRRRVRQETANRHRLTRENSGVAPVADHNRQTYRNWRCRCDACKADHAAKMLAWRTGAGSS